MAETMRLLKVDEHFASEMARLIAYAKEPGHYFHPGRGRSPRSQPGHVTMLGEYEVTYAFTACGCGSLWRCMSVALIDAKANGLPCKSVLEFFGRQLGFQSPFEQWDLGAVPASRMVCAGEHLAG